MGGQRSRWPWKGLKVSGHLLVTLLFFGGCLATTFLLPIADDEGFLNEACASGALRHPVAVLLALKCRPMGTLLNMGAVATGWTGFMVWHILLASAAVYLVGVVGGRLQGGKGWLASLVLATSPAFFESAVTGQSNSDGIFAVALLSALFQKGCWFWAGAIAGAVPFIRYEYSPYAIALLVVAFIYRLPWHRMLIGASLVPLGLWLLGAAYHRDVLWWQLYPPALPLFVFPSYDEYKGVDFTGTYLAQLPFFFFQASSLWAVGFTFFTTWRKGGAIEAAYAWSGLAVFLAMLTFPFFKFFGVGHNPRYLQVLLPFLVFSVSRIPLIASGKNIVLPFLSFAVGALLVITGQWAERLFGALGLALPLVIRSLCRKGPKVILGACALGAFVGLSVLLMENSHFARALPGKDREAVIERLLGLARDEEVTAIYTNDKLLHGLLLRRSEDLASKVHLLHQYDTAYELYMLLDHRNGQFQDFVEGMRKNMYGINLWPCEFAEVESFDRSVLVLQKDERFALAYPMDFIDSVWRPVFEKGDFKVMVGSSRPKKKMEVKEDFLFAPCVETKTGR